MFLKIWNLVFLFFSINYGYSNCCSAKGQVKWCTFFLAAIANHPIFEFLDEALTSHLKIHERILDYFLLDYSLLICSQNILYMHECVEDIPLSNPYIYFLADNINNIFDYYSFEKILKHTSVFKLQWRTKISRNKDSYWNHLIMSPFL